MQLSSVNVPEWSSKSPGQNERSLERQVDVCPLMDTSSEALQRISSYSGGVETDYISSGLSYF